MKRETILVRAVIKTLVAFALAMAVCSAIELLCGCTRKVYVPVESVTVRTDTLYRSQFRTDTVKVTERVYESDTRYDSIAPILDSLNRVIGWDRYHFRESTKNDSRELQRLQSLVDSLRAVKRDSVDRPVPYPVERKLTKWEQTKQDCGEFAIAFMVVALAVIAWLVIKRRKE